MSEQAAPVRNSSENRMPPGIPYIVGNEAAERFSFYGMKAILFVYLTKYLAGYTGQLDPMTTEDARFTVHLFVASAYFFPMLGALLSDCLLGKYRTIFWLSLVYCLGHLALAGLPGRIGLLSGLTLIAIGSGGIKPCVSAHVGDQFSPANQHLMQRVYSWFYFSINFGAFFSTLITPKLLQDFGPHWGPHFAFGLPGVLMLLATFVFWLGRKKFVHIKPGGVGFIREAFGSDGLKALSSLIPIYLFVSIFWALYDQTASAWVDQAEAMDRNWLGTEWLPSQIQAVNPILVLILIPASTYFVYPAIETVVKLTALRKVAIGFFITVISFGISAGIESQITGGLVIRNAALEKSPNEHEIIVRLREHKSWKFESIGWTAPYLKDENNLKDEKTVQKFVPLSVRVEVGNAPKGTWKEVAKRDFSTSDEVSVSSNLAQYTIKLPQPTEAAYVRLVVLSLGDGTDTANSVNWRNEQVVKVLSSEASPPAHADRRAAAVWPDVAAVGFRPNIFWQIVAYFFLTLAEVMVSITCLEFSYTQAPNKMKSFVMSLYMLSVTLGNLITALVNWYIQNPGASYYWFFTGSMLAASIGFLVVVATYRERVYLQSKADAE